MSRREARGERHDASVLIDAIPGSPVDYELKGASLGDYIRHFEVRMGFLKGFVTDKKVLDLYRNWNQLGDIGTKATATAVAYEKLGRILGKSSRFDIFEESQRGLLAIDPTVLQLPATQKVLGEIAVSQTELFAVLDSLMEGDGLIDAAIAFLDSYGLCWNWLVMFTVTGFRNAVQAYVQGGEQITSLALSHAEPPVPDNVDMTITALPGETAAEVRRRLKARYHELDRQLAKVAATGPLPRKTRETCRAYGEWLYRVTLGGESVRGLARNVFANAPKPEDRTSSIRYGLSRARALLAIGDQFDIPTDPPNRGDNSGS